MLVCSIINFQLESEEVVRWELPQILAAIEDLLNLSI